MKKTIRAILVFFINGLAISSVTKATPLKTLSFFDQGVMELQKQNNQKASESLLKALEIHPHSSATFYNLGLAQMRLKNSIPSMAYFRQALYLNAWNFSAKKALKHFNKPVPFLFHLPKESVLFLLGFSLFLLIFSFAKWKVAFLLLSIGVSGWYYRIKSDTWKTVIQETSVRTAPDEKASSILTLTPGDFVMEISSSKDLWLSPKDNVSSQVNEPISSGNQIHSLAQKEVAESSSETKQWVQIKTQNQMAGWINAHHLFLFPTP